MFPKGSSGCPWTEVGTVSMEQGAGLGGACSGPGSHTGLDAAGGIRVSRQGTDRPSLAALVICPRDLDPLDHEPALP